MPKHLYMLWASACSPLWLPDWPDVAELMLVLALAKQSC
jgi:hypothetical protein